MVKESVTAALQDAKLPFQAIQQAAVGYVDGTPNSVIQISFQY